MGFKSAHEIANQVVHENYGPEGDPEVWAIARRDLDHGRIDSETVFQEVVSEKHLLDAALVAGHLDGDGILAMLRAVVAADRAQRRTVWVVQTEEGDVLDVIDNPEYAAWLTREDEDVPARTKTEQTVWSGPTDRASW